MWWKEKFSEQTERSYVSDVEKKELMDILCKHKDVLSFRDKIDKCMKIEIEIGMKDKSPLFIKPYHVKEEDKVVLDEELKRLCYLGVLKEAFQLILVQSWQSVEWRHRIKKQFQISEFKNVRNATIILHIPC